jgi:hypothetical protein
VCLLAWFHTDGNVSPVEKGLTSPGGSDSQTQRAPDPDPVDTRRATQTQQTKQQPQNNISHPSAEGGVQTKKEPEVFPREGYTQEKEDYNQEYDDYNEKERNYQEYSAHMKTDRPLLLQYVEKGAGSYSCTECGKITQGKRDIMDHVEIHFPGTYEYTCDICSVVLDTRMKYYYHKRSHNKK